ncbi:MAG: peroxidase-related enzyme [Elstera cyanobacteriorum]|nr:peroxidase-related enzyme [Elstera cyanobacteriorum]MCK6444656.1 peroxidase-related enzyme [Elstera cyanobacteriorum]
MDLHTPDEASLPDDLKPYFQKCRDKLGMVPNVLRAWLLRPEKLRTFIASYNELMLGASGLSKLEREMIAVAVSAVNRCYYCLVAHGAAVRQMSGDPELGEMLVMNYRVAELPARQRAMLDFAVKLTETPHLITANDRASLSAQGFSDEDVFDICEVTGFFNMTNRVAHGVDMMPNPEYHRQAR